MLRQKYYKPTNDISLSLVNKHNAGGEKSNRSQPNLRYQKDKILDFSSDETPTSLTLEQEILNTRHLFRECQKIMHNILLGIMQGKTLDVSEILQLTERIYDQVVSNSDAVVYCSLEKKPANYTSMSAICFCALMLNYCKEMGYSHDDLLNVGVGALLHDVGKMWVCQFLINKPKRLSKKELVNVKDHVAFSKMILHRSEVTNDLILDIVLKHHERLDGTGYPNGSNKKQLSTLSQMAMIVDVYDAMTSNRCYKNAVTPFEALQYLLSQNKKFSSQCAQQFIKLVGIYPIGTLVRLRSGLLGIVTSQTDDLLNPNVKAIFDIRSKRHIPPTFINTKECSQQFKENSIVNVVPRSEFSVNMNLYMA